MAVLLECSAGELVIDLLTEECPLATKNFLKLCKMKYYNGCLFYNVQQNYICQTGDPTGSGKGGSSIYGLLKGEGSNSFQDEIVKKRKVDKVGLVCMAHDPNKEHANRSQFFITLRGENLDNLDGKYTIFGEIAEGLEVLQRINELYCDGEGRPFQDMRIKHTYVLDDPFEDLPGLDNLIPPSSPERAIPSEEKVKRRIPYEEGVESKVDARSEAELEQSIRIKEAKSRAIVLEMTGDIPDADVKPPDEVLFVCKLNSVTTDADLELIFSRFGTIKQCDIIKDFKTGDSLSYAFIEFETADSCVEAYEKMNNVLVDDRRIKVDFSQSVSHLWNRFLAKPRANKSMQQGQQGKGAQQNQQASLYKPPANPPKQQQYQQQPAAPREGREGSRWSSNEQAMRDKPESDVKGGSNGDRDGGDRSRDSNKDRDGGHDRRQRSRSGSRDRNRGSDRGGDRRRDHHRSSERGGDRGDRVRDDRNADKGGRGGDRNGERCGERSSGREARSSHRSDRDRSRDKDRSWDRDRSRSGDRKHSRSDRESERGNRENDRDRDSMKSSSSRHRRSRSRL